MAYPLYINNPLGILARLVTQDLTDQPNIPPSFTNQLTTQTIENALDAGKAIPDVYYYSGMEEYQTEQALNVLSQNINQNNIQNSLQNNTQNIHPIPLTSKSIRALRCPPFPYVKEYPPCLNNQCYDSVCGLCVPCTRLFPSL